MIRSLPGLQISTTRSTAARVRARLLRPVTPGDRA